MFHKLKREIGFKQYDFQNEDFVASDKFWIEDKELHLKEFDRTDGNCCFNHQIGLPKLKKEPFNELQIFDYEMEIIRNIEQNKYYALNKARGIGATEIILRWILFKAVQNKIPSRKFLIIPGTRAELARDCIRRIYHLTKKIPNRHVKSSTQEKIVIGQSEIIALPANEDSIRGYENVDIIFADEAAHWDLLDDDTVLEAIEPHRTKSDAHIIIVSTPNGRRGFFASIFFNESTKYFRDRKPWDVAKDLIDQDEIEKIRNEDFYRYGQEYNCQFLSSRYAAFPPALLKIARQNSLEYQLVD